MSARPPAPDALPVLDEHATLIAAPAEEVWAALLEVVEGTFGRRPVAVYARLVASPHTRSSGPRPLAVGATIPGFEVTVARPGEELDLEGRHRFSTYALRFRLEPADGGSTRLVARSDARFPGWAGRLYRLAITRTGFHVGGVRRLLDAVRRRAEAPAR